MPSTRLLSGAFCVVLLLAASPCNVCRHRRSIAPAEAAASGPTLDSLPADQGLVTLWFPDAPRSAFVEVHLFTGRGGPGIFPSSFPVRVAVPLDTDGVVYAHVDDDASFREPFTLTSDHREKEIVIRLTEHRMSGYYGFATSELPTETGFVPLAAPAEGVPGAPVFMERRGAGGWRGPPDMSYSSSLLVDERGDVWFGEIRWAEREYKSAPEPAYQQRGRLDPAVFERMKALRDDAAKGQLDPAPACAACYDCGSIDLVVYGGKFGGTHVAIMAKGASECQVSTSPAAKTIAAWMVALRKQVLPLKPPAVPDAGGRP